MTVNWGFVSTARINRHVLAAARLSTRARVTAVASRDRSIAETYARANGIERAYGGYDDLLADDDVQAVYISLPNSLHVEWSRRALEAGKHVLCEKPLSRHPHDVEGLFAVAEDEGLLVSEAFMYRHNPQTARIKRLVDEGALGRPRFLRASFSFPLGEGPNIRLEPALDGGALMDVGCYCVNASRYLFGEPVSVVGQQVSSDKGVDLLFSGALRFPGDVMAQFDCAFTLPERDELEVAGDDASLFVGDPWHANSPGIELRRGADTELIATDATDSYLLQLDDFSEAISSGTEPLLGRADAVGQARAIEALYRSAEAGRVVDLVAG